jgi:hypothetical protein
MDGGGSGGAGGAGGGGHGGGAGAGDAGVGGAGGSGGKGGAGGATDGGAGGADGGFMSAAHPPLPQVVNSGGPVLTAPKIQLIAYGTDTGHNDISAFLNELTETTYWSEATSEYGVGPLTIKTPILLSGTAPASIDDTTIQTMLSTNLTGANPAWGAPDGNTIYLFSFPVGSIETRQGAACCMQYGGYHDSTMVGGTRVSYAIGCGCHGGAGASLTDLQARTIFMSHELAEAATDPQANFNTAYGQADNNDIIWTVSAVGSELADMCEVNEDAFIVPAGGTYTVQRIWSNAAAQKSQNPCVPATGVNLPYFNAFAALTTVPFPRLGFNATTQAVNIPIGQTKTIDITLFSTAPMPGPWTVSVFDNPNQLANGTDLTLSLDKKTGINGDTLHLTITPKNADPNVQGETIYIFSEYGRGTANFESNVSLAMVTN